MNEVFLPRNQSFFVYSLCRVCEFDPYKILTMKQNSDLNMKECKIGGAILVSGPVCQNLSSNRDFKLIIYFIFLFQKGKRINISEINQTAAKNVNLLSLLKLNELNVCAHFKCLRAGVHIHSDDITSSWQYFTILSKILSNLRRWNIIRYDESRH